MKPFNPGFSQFNGAPKPFASQFNRQGANPGLFGGNRPPGMFGGFQQQLNAMGQAPTGPGFAERLGAFGQQMNQPEEPIQHAQMEGLPVMQAPQLSPTQGPNNIQALLQALYMGRR